MDYDVCILGSMPEVIICFQTMWNVSPNMAHVKRRRFAEVVF